MKRKPPLVIWTNFSGDGAKNPKISFHEFWDEFNDFLDRDAQTDRSELSNIAKAVEAAMRMQDQVSRDQTFFIFGCWWILFKGATERSRRRKNRRAKKQETPPF